MRATKPQPADPAQQAWLDEQLARASSPERVNPCVRLYGLGPAGEKCKHCAHLWRKKRSRTYIKCDLRECTNGPGSDHRAGWPACGKFERATEKAAA